MNVLSRATLTTIGMAIQGLARLLYTIAIGRFASEGALGDTSALLSVAIYLSLVFPSGLGIAGSRYLPVKRSAGGAIGLLNRWFWISSVALALLAFPISLYITGDIWISGTSVALVWSYNAYVYTRGTLMGEDRVLRVAVADMVSAFVSITALVLVLFGQAPWALLLPLTIGYALFAFLGRPRTAPTELDAREKAVIGRFVRDSTISALATGGLLPATMIFVRAFDTPVASDLFAAALSLATPASLLSQAVNQVLIPHFARLHDDDKALKQSHLKLTGVTIVLFAALFGLIIWLAPLLLTLIYGEKFTDGSLPLRALLVVVFLISATCVPSAYLVATGHQRIFALIWFFAFLLGTLIMVIASPILGLWGALLGFAVGGGGGSLTVIAIGTIKPFEKALQ